MKPDAETKQIFTDAEEIRLMTEGRGWQLVEAKLKEKILDLQMIGNVTGATAEEKIRNMEARQIAVEILFEWLKLDVYGAIHQANANRVEDTTQQATYIDNQER